LWNREGRAKTYLDHRSRRLAEAKSLLRIEDFERQIGETERAYLTECNRAQTKRRLLSASGISALVAAAFVVAGVFEASSMRTEMRSAALDAVREGQPVKAARFALAGADGASYLSKWLHRSDPEGPLRDTGFTLKLLLNVGVPYSASTFKLSDDGTRLVTATSDDAGAIWDVDHNEHQILTRTTTSAGKLRDARDGSVLLSLDDGQVKGFRFSPVSDRLVTTTVNKAATLWNSANGQKIIDLASEVDDLTFSLDGTRLSVGSTNSTGALWDPDAGTKIADYRMPLDADGQVEFSENASRLVSSTTNNSGSLWDSRTGRYLADLGGDGAVYLVHLSRDGRRIATQSVYDTVAVWDATSIPQEASGPDLKDSVCTINYDAVGVFEKTLRDGIGDAATARAGSHLPGRPWHPCDWVGLLSYEGWAQQIRFAAVRIGIRWDYQCGERSAFSGIDKDAVKMCPDQAAVDQPSTSYRLDREKSKDAVALRARNLIGLHISFRSRRASRCAPYPRRSLRA
jgi:hypothetical protein